MKHWLWLFGLIGLVLFTVGCGGGGPGGPGIIGGTPGNVNVYATDAPAPGFDAIWVQIAQVDARSGDGTWAPLLSFNPPVELNILDLSTVRQFLGSARLPAGAYDRIRVTLAGARVVQNGASTQVPLTPNVIEIPATLTVSTTGGVELVIDFQGSQGLVSQDAGGFHFDHSKVGVVINPIQSGNPMPPVPTDPGRRPVLVKGEILSIDPGSQSFTVEVHDSFVRGGPPTLADGQAPDLVVTWTSQTVFEPQGKTFKDLTVGGHVAVVGMPANGGLQALQVTIAGNETPSNSIKGAVLEVLYDLNVIKLGVGEDNPCLQVMPCAMAPADNFPEHPRFPIPLDFMWVAVTPTTTIQTPDGTTLALSDVTPGQFLQVTGAWQSDFFIATTITVFQTQPGPNEISGAIESIDSTRQQLQVGFPMGFGDGEGGSTGGGTIGTSDFVPPTFASFTVQVSSSTTLAKSDGTAITFGELQVGMLIHAEGSFDSSNVFQATRIMVAEFQPPEDRIFGTVSTLKPDANEFVINLGPMPLGGGMPDMGFTPPPTPLQVTVKVTSNTQMQDSEGNALTFADLQIGDFVTVKGNFDPNTTNLFVADSVWVLHSIPMPGHVEGTIQSTDASTSQLVIEPFWDDPWVGPNTPQITVHVQDTATIQDSDGNALTFGQLQPGNHIEADGSFDSSGVFQATEVTVLQTPPPPSPVEMDFLAGAIVQISPNANSFQLALQGGRGGATGFQPPDIRVTLGSDAQILDRNGNPQTFSALAIGEFVLVRGQWASDQGATPTFTAQTVVIVANHADEQVAAGEISAMDSTAGTFTITQSMPWMQPETTRTITVTVGSGAVIQDHTGQTLAFSDLHTGEHVVVFGTADSSNANALTADFVMVVELAGGEVQ